jgi:uncharacterized protein HemX
MKTIFITIIMMFVCSGCLEMVTPGDVVTTQDQINSLKNSIDNYQANVSGIADQLEKDKLISSDTANKLSDLNAKVDELQPTVEEAVNAVLNAEYSGDKVSDILIATSAANKVSAPVNPYSGLIDSGLNLLLGVLGVGTAGGVYVAKKNSNENKRVVSNINKIAAESNPEEGRKLVAAINGK